MKKILAIIFVILSLANFSFAITNEVSSECKAIKIEKFLIKKCPFSPLIGYGKEIVKCAEYYGLDYRLYVAIAGAESTFGKHYLVGTYNFTGINSGHKKFKSITDNIWRTHNLIGTKNYYWKYRKTKNIRDLVFVYKGVPPFSHYIKNVLWIFKEIDRIE